MSHFTLITYCLLSFLTGSIPFGFLLVKYTNKLDVRTSGSGNIGATNVMRTGGKKLGLITLLLDCAKGAIPILLAKYVNSITLSHLSYVALCAVIGHVFTPWLRFKGGKGVATACGAILAFSPIMFLPSLLIFILTLIAFRYVSLSSIAAATTFIATTAFKFKYDTMLNSGILSWFAIAAIIIVKHYSNIIRIINKTEPKL